MIGLMFIFRVLMVVFFILIALGLLLGAYTLLSMAIKAVAERMGWQINTDITWLKDRLPKIKFNRRRKRKK